MRTLIPFLPSYRDLLCETRHFRVPGSFPSWGFWGLNSWQTKLRWGRQKEASPFCKCLMESLVFAKAGRCGRVPGAFYTLPSSQREGTATTVPGTCSHFILPLPLQMYPPFHWYHWSPGDELPVPSRIPGWNSSLSSPWRRSNTCLCSSSTAQGSMDMDSLKKNHTCLFPFIVTPNSLQTHSTNAFFQKMILPSYSNAIPEAPLRLAKNQSLKESMKDIHFPDGNRCENKSFFKEKRSTFFLGQ